MGKSLREFIDRLAKTKVGDNAFNLFSYGSPHNEVRRSNLLLYFQQMAEKKPEVLLVGEAPGYQGCRMTGVNFTSEHILINGIKEIEMFGQHRGYQKTGEYEKIWKEPSATIVWKTISKCKQLPLLWASFPFHPYQSGNPLSNRTPTNTELKVGENFVQDIIEIFDVKRVIAVGNKAEITLGQLAIPASKIRHPSHGGAKLFAEGVRVHIL